MRFFAGPVFFFAVFFFDAFFGTFLPFGPRLGKPDRDRLFPAVDFLARAAALQRPALRFFITRSTSAEAFLEYFRAMIVLPFAGK